ncbi:DNA topoisomerase III [Fulvitalea axinellae]|uniref:DNA topoisomerase n=1 Tax=Fulvitalea axinellae TaxID=1182444 RepID=A0AAU9C8X9_9BACT|nr:DNA topoisomerase III [Fulvitalea axinellae]
MKVCIAEKPSVAREIATILGADRRHDGYFEGNGYQVTWTFGHLCTLKEPRDYVPEFGRWSLQTLPIIPPRFGVKVMDDDGVQKQFRTIAHLMGKAEEIINCGDAGQEGELIQRWVMLKAKVKCPVKRLWISSLTKEAILEGFKNLRPQEEFDRLYAAGSSRAMGDWLLGINATRAYTLKYGGGKGTLSIGRVQTPTLALIANRQKEIDNFKPEPYWELKTVYRNVRFAARSGKFTDKEKAKQALEKINPADFQIDSFEKKAGKELPPNLFDLTALQVECNKKFGFSADQTLKLVQGLYERKLVTYPRVDTVYLPNDIYPKVPGILKSMANYSALTEKLFNGKPLRKSAKVFNDKKVTDHHAIIPTNVTANHLGAEDFKVYETIAKRFVAVFYPDCKVSKTKVDGNAAQVPFRATGKQIVEPGWREVYGNDKPAEEKPTGEDEGQVMPEFRQGEKGPHAPDLAEKMTKPPKYYTEATLLRAMETAGKLVEDDTLREAMKENGIGRPSTRANIIETLFRRKYIIKQKKRLEATETGMRLVDTIHNDLLKSAELTGQWEHKLRLIEKGEYDVKTFIQEMRDLTGQVVREAKAGVAFTIVSEEAGKKKKARATAKKTPDETQCPKCKQGKLLKGKSAYGCARWKDGCDFKLPFVVAGKKLSDSQVNDLVSKGKTRLLKGLDLGGRKADGFLTLDASGNVGVEEKAPEKTACPACGGETLKGKNAYGCANWKQGCKFRLPFELYGKKLTDRQIQDLLTKGKTGLIKGFVEDGVKFGAKLSFNSEGVLKVEREG